MKEKHINIMGYDYYEDKKVLIDHNTKHIYYLDDENDLLIKTTFKNYV